MYVLSDALHGGAGRKRQNFLLFHGRAPCAGLILAGESKQFVKVTLRVEQFGDACRRECCIPNNRVSTAPQFKRNRARRAVTFGTAKLFVGMRIRIALSTLAAVRHARATDARMRVHIIRKLR